MKWKIRFLKVFSYGWIWLAFVFISLNLIAEGVTSGWWTALPLTGPNDLINFLFVVLTFVPGFVARRWADRLERRSEARTVNPKDSR